MACLGMQMHMHHGTVKDCVIRKQDDQSGRVTGSTHLRHLTIPNRKPSTAVNAAVTYNSGLDIQLQTNNITDNEYKFNDRTSIESPRVSETLDEWMEKSVTEIVNNITQTPLLIQIYNNGEVKKKKPLKGSNEWKKHRSSSSSSELEGVILVEEISGEVSGEADDGDNRVYGVLIQGKVKGRDECRSTCYLLKTSSVCYCTHFCLMKVKSFHENVFSQFRDCWLV